jgi:hypothetical protein
VAAGHVVAHGSGTAAAESSAATTNTNTQQFGAGDTTLAILSHTGLPKQYFKCKVVYLITTILQQIVDIIILDARLGGMGLRLSLLVFSLLINREAATDETMNNGTTLRGSEAD